MNKRMLKKRKKRMASSNSSNWLPQLTAPKSALILDEKQTFIYDKLKNFLILSSNKNFGDIYKSGLEVFQSKFSSRHSLVAHCFREIMEKLPEAVAGIRATTSNGTNRESIQKIRTDWDNMTVVSPWNLLMWHGQVIDVPMDKFLRAFQVFHRSGIMNGPTRKDLKSQLMKYIHRSNPSTSSTYENALVKRWSDIERYMINVSHNSETTEEKFLENKMQFEELLYELFKQPTLEYVDDIESMIKAGEKK